MATQSYRHKTDKTVGANVTTQKLAPGHAPELQPKPGAENKTPAPTRTPEQMRSTSWGRSGGDPGDNSGKNGYAGASSLNPGERSGPATVNPLASTDAVLDNIIRDKEAGGDSWQTRRLDDPRDHNKAASPIHPAMHKNTGSPSGVVPPKTGYVEGAPGRKPGA